METTLTRLAALRLRPGQSPDAAARAELTADEFAELVRAHQRRIYRVLLGLVHDPDAAATLTQECFLRAYQNYKNFRGESSVATWLVRIAVNLATDHGRSRRNAFWRRLFAGTKAEEATAETVADPHASPERQLVAREELKAVWSAVETLSPQQRAVFVLRFAEEMSLEEVAQATSLELGTVKTHLARALGKLRARLKENRPHARTFER